MRAEEVVAREEEAMSAAKISTRVFLIFFFIFSVLSFFYGCFSAGSLFFSSIVSSFVFLDFVFCTLKKALSGLTCKILIRFFCILFVSFFGTNCR